MLGWAAVPPYFPDTLARPRRRLLKSLQFLAGFETHGLAGWNRYLCSCSWIPSNPRLAGLHIEYAKAAQFDTIALLKSAFHTVKYRLYRGLSLGLGNACPV